MMKPQQANVDWCLANAKVVMRWLGQRGGWQDGDWFTYPAGAPWLLKGPIETHMGFPDRAIWLPTSDDVLEMLERQGIAISLLAEIGVTGTYHWSAVQVEGKRLKWHRTPLIALMELLKSLEGENE
jgi:hypothetical protein